MKKMSKKGMTKKGKERKTRICQKRKNFYMVLWTEKIARQLFLEKKDDIVREFQTCVKKAFIDTAI